MEDFGRAIFLLALMAMVGLLGLRMGVNYCEPIEHHIEYPQHINIVDCYFQAEDFRFAVVRHDWEMARARRWLDPQGIGCDIQYIVPDKPIVIDLRGE